MTPLYNHLTISKIFIILYLTLIVSFAHSTFCVFFFFLVLLLHDNHVQPVCTFLSCTFLLILIFKSTVYCHAHFFIFYILFFISYSLLILCIFPLCLYSIIFALSMERTWLTFHCWLYTHYIIVYVTNKNLESWNDLNVFYCRFEKARLTPSTRSDLHFTHSPSPPATLLPPPPFYLLLKSV